MSTHTGEKLYTCNKCNKAVSCTSSLKVHMGTHTGEKTYICNQFNKAFSCAGYLRTHISTHTGEKPYHYQCSWFDKCSSRKESWDTHRKKCIAHKSIGSYFWVYSIMYLLWYKIKDTKLHAGETPYQCGHCAKSFWYRNVLIVYLKTHSGENPYKCNQWNKAFSLSSYLRNNLKRHSEEKLYKCNQCNKTFH